MGIHTTGGGYHRNSFDTFISFFYLELFTEAICSRALSSRDVLIQKYIINCHPADFRIGLLSAIQTNFFFLTNHHTMPHFDALKICSCRKHCEKRSNCLKQAIAPFLTTFATFSNLHGTYFSF